MGPAVQCCTRLPFSFLNNLPTAVQMDSMDELSDESDDGSM